MLTAVPSLTGCKTKGGDCGKSRITPIRTPIDQRSLMFYLFPPLSGGDWI